MISNPAIENKSIKQNKIKVMFHCRKLNTLACSNCPLAISQAHTAVPVLPEKKLSELVNIFTFYTYSLCKR